MNRWTIEYTGDSFFHRYKKSILHSHKEYKILWYNPKYDYIFSEEPHCPLCKELVPNYILFQWELLCGGKRGGFWHSEDTWITKQTGEFIGSIPNGPINKAEFSRKDIKQIIKELKEDVDNQK